VQSSEQQLVAAVQELNASAFAEAEGKKQRDRFAYDPDAKLKVLLLGNYRPTLTIARILSAKGHQVFSGDEGWEGGAQFSSSVGKMWSHPKLADDKATFFEALSDYTIEHEIDLVYPVSENFVSAFVENPEWAEGLPPIAMHKPEQNAACLDKFGMYDRAQRLGVPTMLYARVETERQLRSTMQTVGLPLVIRPENCLGRFDNKKVFTITSDDDLKWFLDHWETEQTALLCQKFASGPRHNIYFAAERGQIFRYLEAKILNTDIPDGSGLATEGITLSPNPVLREYTNRLIADLDYTGIGCAQFLVDEATGDVSFLEVNSRIAGNHAVPEAAGLELTEVPLLMAFNQPQNFVRKDGKVGLKYVWTSGALVGAKVGWIRGDLTLWQSVAWMVRALYLGFVADVHMVFSWRDPKPAFMAMGAVLPSLHGFTRRIKNLLRRK